MQDDKLLHYDDTGSLFIRHATQLIENKFPISNDVLEIQPSSCRIAGNLLCNYLLKILFAIYNVEPVLLNDNLFNNELTSSKKFTK